jgi:hypothetical protein
MDLIQKIIAFDGRATGQFLHVRQYLYEIYERDERWNGQDSEADRAHEEEYIRMDEGVHGRTYVAVCTHDLVT